MVKKLRKRDIILIAIFLIVITVVIISIKTHGFKSTEEILTEQYLASEGADDILRNDVYDEPTIEEYYGTYNQELESNDKEYIEAVKETIKDPLSKELLEKVKDYKLDSNILLKDYDGNIVSPISSNNKIMIFFAGIYKDEKGYRVNNNSNEIAALKAGRADNDPIVYILPYDKDIPRDEFLKLIANGDYYNSLDPAIAELYDLVEGHPNSMLFFNKDGNPLFATSNCNLLYNINLASTAVSNITLKEVYEQLTSLN